MSAFILRRVVSTILVMAIIGVFVFLLLRLSPGNPAAIIAGDNATPEVIAGIAKRLGLDEPIPTQFFHWALRILGGDLGVSIFTDRPVAELIAQRLEPTLSLSVLTLIASTLLGVTFGVLAAWRAGGWLDRILTLFATVGFSAPVFVVGYFLIYCLAINQRWLPVQGYTPIALGPWPWLEHLVLPTMSLALGYTALIARITRASMLEVLSEDYVRTAEAKGASTFSILFRHALKNAGHPIVTIIGLGFALLISGVVITETVFNIPGIGRLTVDAINNKDYPIIQGVLILVSGACAVINFAVDISYVVIDPRIRHQS